MTRCWKAMLVVDATTVKFMVTSAVVLSWTEHGQGVLCILHCSCRRTMLDGVQPQIFTATPPWHMNTVQLALPKSFGWTMLCVFFIAQCTLIIYVRFASFRLGIQYHTTGSSYLSVLAPFLMFPIPIRSIFVHTANWSLLHFSLLPCPLGFTAC